MTNVNKTIKLDVTRECNKDVIKEAKVIISNIFVNNITTIKQNAVAEKSFNLSLLSIYDLKFIRLFFLTKLKIKAEYCKYLLNIFSFKTNTFFIFVKS